ncbi:MAG: InlB B-repeat-containing protein [Clostridiales bacterium]|jgi:hypothetical protein|nr:InlB B-repeat-containing protein [Clostridiales bacterium]
MSFDRDVIVFLNDDEQEYMKAGLPSLNGRKYRYVSPETGDIEEGVLEFAFLHIGGFESESVSLTLKGTETRYDILYGVSVEYQLGLVNAPTGIYTVRETNVFGEFSEYEAVYIRPGDMTGEAVFEIFRDGILTERTIGKSNAATVYAHGFILKALVNELDPYSIVKITKDGNTRIYTFDEVADIWFAEGGVYSFTLVDRLGNDFSFEVIIDNPVGYADIYLELEFEDETITTYYRAFAGQEIELPIPTLSNELFVFDGWVYDDTLITNGKFTPDRSGTLYIWQQVTQRYTYLNFDTDGGGSIPSIKVEIGTPIELPTAQKDGWAFGGWEYGGAVYSGAFTPTTASPTFVAVWNYLETNISLYDGNLYQTITAHAGEKVLLPFPTRSGFTFFGWYLEESAGVGKVYYGQITSLANVTAMRLDALWIRNGDVSLDGLENGTGGRTRVHFVDGTLDPTFAQGFAGAALAMPNPTRAGYTLVGWVWRTTSISGKIYTGGTMTVPENAGGKIMLEAIWTARATGGAQGQSAAAGTASPYGSGTAAAAESGLSLSSQSQAGLLATLFAVFALAIVYIAAKRRERQGLFGSALVGQIKNRTACKPPVTAENMRLVSFELKPKRAKKVGFAKLGSFSTVTALALVVALFALSAFGDWDRLGAWQGLIKAGQQETTAQTEQTYSDASLFNGLEFGNSEIENKPTKDEVIATFMSAVNASGEAGGQDNALDISDGEAFLYALIMLDLYSLGYDVFPAKALLQGGAEVLGLGYSDYAEAYESGEESDETIYFGAGFVAFPRQAEITEEDIENGVYIIDAYAQEPDGEQSDEGIETVAYGYILSFTESYGPCHYVADGQYVVYSVTGTEVLYTSAADESVYNPEYGAVYSYDDGRNVFDPDLGAAYNVSATSLNTLLDPVIAKGEYERYIAEQTANGFTVDTMNFVYISYSALDAYYLSNQDESLLGIDVEEFYQMERMVGPNQYYWVDENGNLSVLDFPQEEEDKATWLDRLAGAALAVGAVLTGVIIIGVLSVVSCGIATAAAPYIMGAFIGAGMEIFMQTVVQGKKIKDINWVRVSIAAVSGALAAIPGIGWLGAGLLQGGTEAAMTWAEGGSIEDILKAFTVGFITGVVIHGVGKALSKIKFCFVAGTAVVLASGSTKAIEDIKVGDYVKSYNETIGQVENKRVLQTFENTVTELTKITTSDGQEIVATPGHKFFANGAWISAEDLRAGDILVNVNGQKVVVEAIQHEILEKPVKVYNFEVDGNHNYFVGDNDGVLVHNAACWIKKDATAAVRYKAQGGKVVTAYKQPNGVYLVDDISGHGGSSLKILEEHGGKYLKLLGDADAAGKLIINKHSSQAGKLFEIIKRLF